MAIAFDASTSLGTGTGTLSATHTPVAIKPRGVFICVVQDASGVDHISTTPTYGGVSLVELTPPSLKTGGETSAVYIYGLMDSNLIPAGPQTASVTVSGASNKTAYCITVTAGKEIELVDIDVFTSNANSVGQVTLQNAATRSCWVLAACAAGHAAVTEFQGGGTTTTAAAEIDFGAACAGFYYGGPTTSTSINAGGFGTGGGASDDWNTMGLIVAEVTTNKVDIHIEDTDILTTDTNIYTHTAMLFGGSAVDQVTLVSIGSRANAGRGVSGVTIDGIASVQVVSATQTDGSTFTEVAEIWGAPTPSNPSGDVVVTYTGNMLRNSVSTHRMIGTNGLINIKDFFSDNKGSGASPLTGVVDIPENGAAIGTAWYNTAAGVATWTGLMEDYEGGPESSSNVHTTGAWMASAALVNRTVSVASSTNFNAGSGLAVASFAPHYNLTGLLVSGAAVAIGLMSVMPVLTSTGLLISGAATLSGLLGIQSTISGLLSSGNASVLGTLSVPSIFSGLLTSGSATLSSLLTQTIIGQGLLVSPAAQIIALLEVEDFLQSNLLLPGDATLQALMTVSSIISGLLQSDQAAIVGLGQYDNIFGLLISDPATMTGYNFYNDVSLNPSDIYTDVSPITTDFYVDVAPILSDFYVDVT